MSLAVFLTRSTVVILRTLLTQKFDFIRFKVVNAGHTTSLFIWMFCACPGVEFNVRN